MTYLFLEHDPLDQPFRLGELIAARGGEIRRVRLYDGDPVPDSLDGVTALVSLGGHQNVDETDRYPWMQPERDVLLRAHEFGVPVLGVCLGAQLLAEALGGEVRRVEAGPEIGPFHARRSDAASDDPLLRDLPRTFAVMQCHGYEVSRLPEGAGASLASSDRSRVQVYRVGDHTYGLQFHPEWTRDAFAAVLESNRDWACESGYSWDALQERFVDQFRSCREHGDRVLSAWIDRVIGGATAR